MAQPDFTPYERYLINMYRSGVTVIWTIWVVEGAIVLLFLYGLRQDDRSLMIAAFALLALFELIQSLRQPRAFRALRSVFDKYEARIEELSGETRAAGSE